MSMTIACRPIGVAYSRFTEVAGMPMRSDDRMT